MNHKQSNLINSNCHVTAKSEWPHVTKLGLNNLPHTPEHLLLGEVHRVEEAEKGKVLKVGEQARINNPRLLCPQLFFLNHCIGEKRE